MIVTARKFRSKEYITGQLCVLEIVRCFEYNTKFYVQDNLGNTYRIITETMQPNIFKKHDKTI